MKRLHSNFFVGLEYTNKKRQTHKIEKVEKHISKVIVALSYITTPLTMTNMKLMMTMTENMKKMKLGKFLENQFAERNCGTTLNIWKAKKLQ